MDDKITDRELFTKTQIYRIIANFALAYNTESCWGGVGDTTSIAKELEEINMVDFDYSIEKNYN